MLLLVIEADLEDAEHLAQPIGVAVHQQLLDGGVDMRTISANLGRAGTGNEPPPRPLVARSGRDIVRIE